MEIFKHATRRSFHSCRITSNKKMPDDLKGRSSSSQRWLVRQLQDPYVEKAKQENYRCRSAFKLLEINAKFKILSPGMVVVDCGAAPGSWSQVAAKLTNATGKDKDQSMGRVLAIDRLPIFPIAGADTLGNLDFTTEAAQSKLRELLNGSAADVVLSDMAPNASGVRAIDHVGIIDLAYAVLKFAVQVSKVGATLVVKLWDGEYSKKFEQDVSKFYTKIKISRPDATRDESSEKFVLARGFKGIKSPI